MGQGVGISIVTAVLSNMLQVNHAELAERMTATSQAVVNQVPALLTGNPTFASRDQRAGEPAGGDAELLDDFWLMMLMSLSAIPLILLLRKPKAPPPTAKPKTQEEIALERAHAMAE